MQTGDFIRLAYTAKLKETKQVIDQADNAVVIIGAGYVLPGVDLAVAGLTIGEKKTVEIQPDQAFGTRDQKMVKLVPEAEFRRHGTKPVPGMPIEADGTRGRVISVTSGRVTVDFNHPLAGKVLVFDLEVKKKMDLLDEKIKGIFEFYARQPADKVVVKVSGTEVELDAPPMAMHPVFRKKIADDIMKWLDLTKVKFAEVFEKPKEQ